MSGVSEQDEPARIGVLGAGATGAGIAQVTATAGYTTVCYDVDAAALDRAREITTTGRNGFERGVGRGTWTRGQADAASARLTFTNDLAESAGTAPVGK